MILTVTTPVVQEMFTGPLRWPMGTTYRKLPQRGQFRRHDLIFRPSNSDVSHPKEAE